MTDEMTFRDKLYWMWILWKHRRAFKRMVRK